MQNKSSQHETSGKKNQTQTRQEKGKSSEFMKNQNQNSGERKAGEQVFSSEMNQPQSDMSHLDDEKMQRQTQNTQSQQPPREINLPTGEKTQVAKEVYGGGQRPAEGGSEERFGTQHSVDPSTSSPRSALDDDYQAGEEADRKPLRNRAAGGETDEETARPVHNREKTNIDRSPTP